VAADGDIQRAIVAVRAGEPVLLPTDTVYGLVTSSSREEHVLRLYGLKGRGELQPTALLAASIDALYDCVPELRELAGVIIEELLPGPYTLVLPNPARRFPWLTGTRTDAIGVRVAELPAATAHVVAAVGCVTATSANEPGEATPATLDDVPARIRDACSAEIDAGRLSGTASTVIDFTASEPRVIREGLAPSAEAIARVRRALAV
jgi:L-threonylcarbamoyladenylate synthase